VLVNPLFRIELDDQNSKKEIYAKGEASSKAGGKKKKKRSTLLNVGWCK
jgi:hypothetical protein